MRRYLVERTFPDTFVVPSGVKGAEYLRSILMCNSDRSVTWIMSYVSDDKTRSYCIYDSPSPEAIRLTAKANGLPVDRIVEVSVLDPYAYPGP